MPGPSLSLILRNGLSYSRKASLLASFGIMLGIALQSGIVLVGVSIMERDSLPFKILAMASALFLIYLGIKSLQPKKTEDISDDKPLKRSRAFFLEGFLHEILKPNSHSIFQSNHIHNSHGATHTRKAHNRLEIVVCGSLFFCGVGFLASSNFISKLLAKYKRHVEILSGTLFVGFGLHAFIDAVKNFSN